METTNTYTVILHKPRRNMKLSVNEYVLADVIYHLSNNPENRQDGWCYASLQTKSDMLDLTKRTILNIQERLIIKGFIEKNERGFTRTTKKWYKNTILPVGEESSLLVNDPNLDEETSQSDEDFSKTGEESSHYNNINEKNNNSKNVQYLPLAERLKEYIMTNNPREIITTANVMGWCNDFRLIIEKDKRPVNELNCVMQFSQNDDFWKFNILSAGTLREKYARLYAKMTKKSGNLLQREQRQGGNYVINKKPLTE